MLERLVETAEQSGDDWGTSEAVGEYLRYEEYEETPIKYLQMVDQDIDWNYGHVGDDDDPQMDKASANRAHQQIADAILGLRGGRAGYQDALAAINRERSRRGERGLDPRAAGWTEDDVFAEAKRIAKNPEKLEHGVFHWRADGRYKRSEAVKIYKRMADAQRMSDKAYAADKRSDLVVRSSDYWVSENPRDYDEDDDEDDEDDDRDAYGIREPKDWEVHQAESDLVPNPSIWVVVAPENKDLWPVAPLQVVTRDQAIALTHGRPRHIALRTGFASEGQARSYADKVEHATIEVSRPSDGTVVYRGSLLGFSDDPASGSLKFVDRGRVIQLADTNVETKLGQGKKALIARRERSGNPARQKNPRATRVGRRIASGGC